MLAFLCLSLVGANAQRNFKPGFVVTNNGDTIRGQINYLGWRSNPSKFSFLPDQSGSNPVLYSIHDCQYFEISGEDVYRRAIVTRDMRPVRIEEVSSTTRDSISTDTVFLRLLVKGNRLTLYQLVDSKERYYLQEGEGNPVELLYKVYISEYVSALEEQMIFRDQLRKYLPEADPSKLMTQINRARYNDRDLTNVIIKLNGDKVSGLTNQVGSNAKSSIEWFVSGGAGVSKLAFGGDMNSSVVTGLSYKTAVVPIIAAGVDLLNDRNLRNFVFRFEMTVSQRSYTGSWRGMADFPHHIQDKSYTLKMWDISPSISLLYNFNTARRVSYYIGAGLACNFANYTTNRYVLKDETDPYYNENNNAQLDLGNLWPSVFLRAGVRINKQFEIATTGDLWGNMTNNSNFSARGKVFSLGLNYFLK